MKNTYLGEKMGWETFFVNYWKIPQFLGEGRHFWC